MQTHLQPGGRGGGKDTQLSALPGRVRRRQLAHLRLNNRQSSEGAPAIIIVHLGRSLEETRVKVEDVARVGLAAWGPTEEEGHLTVGNSLWEGVECESVGWEGVSMYTTEWSECACTRLTGREPRALSNVPAWRDRRR